MKTLMLVIMMVVVFFVLRITNFKKIENKSNIEHARELYEKVNQTLPSSVSAKENEVIILDRLECYAVNNDYTTRIRVCNNEYSKALIEQARDAVKSRPDMGQFVRNINLCPIMYSMCVGKTENNKERCVVFERQCIDYTLDVFWRGAAQYTPQQYRSE